MATTNGRAIVIGGSMSGLFAALLLRRAGWDAQVYERVEAPLSGRGAGIVTHDELVAVLQLAGIDATRDLGVDVVGRITLDRSGRTIASFDCPQIVTSWDRVFNMLREAYADQPYHRGRDLARIEQGAGAVVAHFADGSRVEGDVLVGADGFRSTVRGLLAPDVKPVYVGYTAWRALIAEDAFAPDTRAQLFDVLAFCLPEYEQMLGYPVAGPNNDLRPGHRRYNFVWYRPYDEATELRDLLTDASGHRHALSIPPPLVRPEHIEAMRRASRERLAPQLDEAVRLSQPFIQPIYDVESRRMAFGRVALMGDAAFLGRPHVAAGVTKAALDAQQLVASLTGGRDVEPALEEYERARLDWDRRIVERGRDLGAPYLRPHLRAATDWENAKVHGTPQAVMEEIAILDALR